MEEQSMHIIRHSSNTVGTQRTAAFKSNRIRYI